MKKVLGFLTVLIFSFNVFAVTPWENGAPAGTASPSDLDTLIQANNTALSRLVAGYKSGARIVYKTAGTLTVKSGEVCVSNSDGSDREMLRNTSDTTVSWANIDTGSEENKTYYVYTYGSSSADTFSVSISLSATSPTGITQYLKLGSFVNSGGAIIKSSIVNYDMEIASTYGDYSSKSFSASYLASTDGIVTMYAYYGSSAYGQANFACYTDSSSSPSTLRTYTRVRHIAEVDGEQGGGTSYPVKAGDYYKITRTVTTGSTPTSAMFFIPTKKQ